MIKICLNLLSIPERDDSPLSNLKIHIAYDKNAYQIVNVAVTEFFELNKDLQTEPNQKVIDEIKDGKIGPRVL